MLQSKLSQHGQSGERNTEAGKKTYRTKAKISSSLLTPRD